MNYYEITFSPTGGTKKVANFLANGLFKEAESIDLSDVNEDFSRFSLTEEDMTIIAVPSYNGRVPSTAANRIAKIKGNGAKTIPQKQTRKYASHVCDASQHVPIMQER